MSCEPIGPDCVEPQPCFEVGQDLEFNPGSFRSGIPIIASSLDPTIPMNCGDTIEAAITPNSPRPTLRSFDQVANQRYYSRRFTFAADFAGTYTISIMDASFEPVLTAFRAIGKIFQDVGNELEFELEAEDTGPMILEVSTVLPNTFGEFTVHLQCPNQCPMPSMHTWSCPVNTIPKYYTHDEGLFVLYNKVTDRVWVSRGGLIDIVNFNPATPVLESQITIPGTSNRGYAAIQDPNTDIIVVFVNKTSGTGHKFSFFQPNGTHITDYVITGLAAGIHSLGFFTMQTRGSERVICFLESFLLGSTNPNKLFLIDTSTQTIVTSRDISAGVSDPIYAGKNMVCYSCVENEIVLLRAFNPGGGSHNYLHKINADDLTDVSVIDLGAVSSTGDRYYPVYDPKLNKLLAIRTTFFPIRLDYLNPTTGVVDDFFNIPLGIIETLAYPLYNFKLSSYVAPWPLGPDDSNVIYVDTEDKVETCRVGQDGGWLDLPASADQRLSDGTIYVLDTDASRVYEIKPT